jgi:hypothetical protein
MEYQLDIGAAPPAVLECKTCDRKSCLGAAGCQMGARAPHELMPETNTCLEHQALTIIEETLRSRRCSGADAVDADLLLLQTQVQRARAVLPSRAGMPDHPVLERANHALQEAEQNQMSRALAALQESVARATDPLNVEAVERVRLALARVQQYRQPARLLHNSRWVPPARRMSVAPHNFGAAPIGRNPGGWPGLATLPGAAPAPPYFLAQAVPPVCEEAQRILDRWQGQQRREALIRVEALLVRHDQGVERLGDEIVQAWRTSVQLGSCSDFVLVYMLYYCHDD